MIEKRDKLGRRIPQFDRSAAGKKANQTSKERYGDTIQSRHGTTGGRIRTRGYFGKLKAEGKTDELKVLSRKGAEKTNAIKAEKKRTRREETEVREHPAPDPGQTDAEGPTAKK